MATDGEKQGEKGWSKKDAPMLTDKDGMIGRQQARLAARTEKRLLEVAALEAPRAAVHDGFKAIMDRTKAINADPTNLETRAMNAANAYVTRLSMEVVNSSALLGLLDEIEDLSKENPLRKKLEPLLNELILCEDFDDGRELCEGLNSTEPLQPKSVQTKQAATKTAVNRVVHRAIKTKTTPPKNPEFTREEITERMLRGRAITAGLRYLNATESGANKSRGLFQCLDEATKLPETCKMRPELIRIIETLLTTDKYGDGIRLIRKLESL